jgi:hypothetical protein
MREMAAGRWPSRAPTKKHLDEAKMAPLSAPKVEQATNTGITQDMTPSVLSPNNCQGSRWQWAKRHSSKSSEVVWFKSII